MRTLLLLLLVIATTAVAADQPQDQQAAGLRLIEPLPADGPLRADCVLGNPADPVYVYTNWITGNDAYAHLIQPEQDGCGCGTGFTLEQVSMLMSFGVEDVPVDFSVYVGLAEAVWDPAAGKYVPGQEYCNSSTWGLTAGTAGLYEIYVDLDGACPCATAGDAYFVTFHLPYSFVWWPSANEDDTPDVGVTYYSAAGGAWSDMVSDLGWIGNNIMRARAACCASPVGNEDASLGEVKASYR